MLRKPLQSQCMPHLGSESFELTLGLSDPLGFQASVPRPPGASSNPNAYIFFAKFYISQKNYDFRCLFQFLREPYPPHFLTTPRPAQKTGKSSHQNITALQPDLDLTTSRQAHAPRPRGVAHWAMTNLDPAMTDSTNGNADPAF